MNDFAEWKGVGTPSAVSQVQAGHIVLVYEDPRVERYWLNYLVGRKYGGRKEVDEG
jgi:hypothetical protein